MLPGWWILQPCSLYDWLSSKECSNVHVMGTLAYFQFQLTWFQNKFCRFLFHFFYRVLNVSTIEFDLFVLHWSIAQYLLVLKWNDLFSVHFWVHFFTAKTVSVYQPVCVEFFFNCFSHLHLRILLLLDFNTRFFIGNAFFSTSVLPNFFMNLPWNIA